MTTKEIQTLTDTFVNGNDRQKTKILKNVANTLTTNFNELMKMVVNADTISNKEFHSAYRKTINSCLTIGHIYFGVTQYILARKFKYSKKILNLMNKVRFYSQKMLTNLHSTEQVFDIRKEYVFA